MGAFANRTWVKVVAWIIAAIIVALNMKLVYDMLTEWLSGAPIWLVAIICAALLPLLGLLAYIVFGPAFKRRMAWKLMRSDKASTVASGIRDVEYTHVGVALEHTEGDAEIISAALSMARSHNATITLIHAVDTAGTMVYGDESSSMHGQEDARYLESVAHDLSRRGVDAESQLLYGRPAPQIINACRSHGFDVLVMGSHGHRGIQDLIHGPTVTTVRHAVDIPVLVVRTGEFGYERPQRDSSE
jgi:manganese transport protein